MEGELACGGTLYVRRRRADVNSVGECGMRGPRHCSTVRADPVGAESRFGCRIPGSTRCGFSSWSSLIGFIGAVDCVEERRLRRSALELGVWTRPWARRGRRSDGVDDVAVPTRGCRWFHMPSTARGASYTGCPPMIHNHAPNELFRGCPQGYPHLWSHRCTSETCERDRAGSGPRQSTPVDSVVDKRLEQSPERTVERPPQTCDLRRNSVGECQ